MKSANGDKSATGSHQGGVRAEGGHAQSTVDPHKITARERKKPVTARRNMYAPRDGSAMFCMSLSGKRTGENGGGGDDDAGSGGGSDSEGEVCS